MKILKEGITKIKLDSESLIVKRIKLNGKLVNFSEIHSSKEKNPLGQGIKIITNSPLKLYSTVNLVIEYSTSKRSSSLHFVEPNDTIGKNHWFVYSQCSAILCRSLFPSQVFKT